MVSLDKALELNQVSARVGDNIEIKCDVTGSPTPPIVWRRHGLDLTQLAEEELKVFPDGALYINNVRLIHAGNYTCHAQRNKDVVQTHVLHVHSKLFKVIYYTFNLCRSGRRSKKRYDCLPLLHGLLLLSGK